MSALLGVCAGKAFRGTVPWLAPGVAVGLAISVMELLGVTHPPGGAIALIAVIGGPSIEAQGFRFVVMPALTGSLILLLIALATNNVHPARRYPMWW